MLLPEPAVNSALRRTMSGWMIGRDEVAARSPAFGRRPTLARVRGYLLDGKDHFLCDREVAHRLLEIAPDAPAVLRAGQEFRRQVVLRLVRERGIRQFIEVGAGLPGDGVQRIVQPIASDARVVYLEDDPMVLSHGRALLAEEGRVAVVEGDVLHPEGFLHDGRVRELIDFTEPVAVLMIDVLHYLADGQEAYRAVARLCDALAPGSHLAVSHATASPSAIQAAEAILPGASASGFGRTEAGIAKFFVGFDLDPPGVVEVPIQPPWSRYDPSRLRLYAGVGRIRNRDKRRRHLRE